MAIINWKNIKEFVGRVVKNSSDKTIAVEVENVKVHPLYNKRYVSKKKYQAHDENNSAQIWNIVKIRESKPISKQKRWILVDIIQKPNT